MMTHFRTQLLFCWLIAWNMPAIAAEPARAFLDGLRERGYYDIALEYLQTVPENPRIPSDLKDSVDYERGLTLIAASRSQNDPKLRTKLLSDAEAALKQFTTTRSENSKANAARSQLAQLIAERARFKVQQSKEGETAARLKEATALYDEASTVLAELNKSVNEQLEKIPKVLDSKDRKQAEQIEQRTQLRADNLQTQLMAAAIREESADTVPAGSAEQQKYLSEAATLYEEIYKEYRTRLAGLYARMYQGRCNQRLGKLRDALGFYGELLDQPDEPEAFRTLKTKALRLAMECWLDPSQRKYFEAIKQASRWIDLVRPTEARQDDWLAIRLSLANAYKMQADDADEGEKRLVSQSIAAARTHAEFVAKERSDFQEEARRLVSRLGGPDAEVAEFIPENFEDAKVAGQEALQALEAHNGATQKLASQVAAESDDSAKQALQMKLQESQAASDKSLDDAMRFFRMALAMADRETPQSEVNFVRYFMCYLYYLKQQPYEAALMGEFVARRHPSTAGAVSSAKIALASYIALYDQAPADDTDFETRRVTEMATYIADTWPSRPEASDALITLVPFVINGGELLKAMEFTERIPETSPGRLQAELQTGQAMWGEFITHSQQIRTWQQEGIPEGIKLTDEQAKLDALQQGTIRLLAAAFTRLEDAGQADKTTVTAILSLGQAYVESLQAEKAVEVLEHPQVGPLALVNAKDAVADNRVFVEETYRTALRAFIGSLGSGDDAIDGAMMEKAKQVMASMQQAVANDPDGIQRMLSVYINLAQDIERQMKAADTAEQKQTLSGVFEVFLEQISSGSNDLNVLNWVAETFSSLGAGFVVDGQVGPDARKYYDQSIAAFNNMLQRPDLPEASTTQIKLRIAQAHAMVGSFDEAMNIFEEVLGKNAMMLNVQVAAAKMLQDWAVQDPEKYVAAMRGMKEGKSAVWGWGKIASTTVDYPKFRDTFYEARYEYARSALELSKSKQAAQRDTLLSEATKALTLTYRLYPTLGGDAWPAKYHELMKSIQAAQGKPADGFPDMKIDQQTPAAETNNAE